MGGDGDDDGDDDDYGDHSPKSIVSSHPSDNTDFGKAKSKAEAIGLFSVPKKAGAEPKMPATRPTERRLQEQRAIQQQINDHEYALAWQQRNERVLAKGGPLRGTPEFEAYIEEISQSPRLKPGRSFSERLSQGKNPGPPPSAAYLLLGNS